MGTLKNRLSETILLSTQNISSRCWIRSYLQFYAQKLCLSKPMDIYIIKKKKLTMHIIHVNDLDIGEYRAKQTSSFFFFFFFFFFLEQTCGLI